MLVSNLSDIKQMYDLKLYFAVSKVVPKDSLNKAKVRKFKWRIRAQHYDKSFHRRVLHEKALQEAEMAFDKGEIPVGAIIVVNDSDRAKS
jgi:hypothetical protein